jgi:hypothetical protein
MADIKVSALPLSNSTYDGTEYVLGIQTGSSVKIPTTDFVNTIASGTGAVSRTVKSKLNDVISVKDYGAVGDGVADDTAAITASKNFIDANKTGILTLTNGYSKTSSPIFQNNISQEIVKSDCPSVIGVFDGTDIAPNTVNYNPAIWAQKYTKYNQSSYFDQSIGAVYGTVSIKGTGLTGTADTNGSWIGILGNTVLNGANQGSLSIPDYDAYGSTIGVAGFAKSYGYPGAGAVITGIWGWAEGPALDSTTYANLPNTNWSLIGCETNITINSPDIGEQSVLVGKGSSVGYLAYNYRTTSSGIKDWTFGMVLSGTPDDGNYSSSNIDNWNGFYTGILLDKIKAKGIRFGQYFKTGSYGIYFPDTYAGSQSPAAGIYMGNTQLNWANYTGSSFNNGDMWANSGTLYYKKSGVNYSVVLNGETKSLGIGTTPSAGQTLAIASPITGSTTSWNIVSFPNVQSDVTSNAGTYYSQIGTQAAAFTLANLYHFNATQGTFGSGSSVTNQYGFFAGVSVIGASNNYGFYGNIAAAAGRFNFYAAGTAANFFAGDMQFGKTVTAGGTTGAQTINKTSGTVNFAAAATSLVVTNSLVTTSSIIICTVGTNDTTMKSVIAVAASGSFTLTANAAATAETRVNFLVIN